MGKEEMKQIDADIQQMKVQIGHNIAKFRNEKKIYNKRGKQIPYTLKNLSMESGLSQSTIVRLEDGNYKKIDLKKLLIICKCLDINFFALLKGTSSINNYEINNDDDENSFFEKYSFLSLENQKLISKLVEALLGELKSESTEDSQSVNKITDADKLALIKMITKIDTSKE